MVVLPPLPTDSKSAGALRKNATMCLRSPGYFCKFFTKTLAYVQNLLYLCSGFQSENGRNCDIIRNTNTLWIYKETSM